MFLGITTPYTYFGSAGSTFAFHTEDLRLCSINRHIYGAPKIWYFVHPEDSGKYEQFIYRRFGKSENCKRIFKHKLFIVSPILLADAGIRVTKVIQKPGEYIVTYADTYHMGYNTGFNINEAVNFMMFKDIDKNLELNELIRSGQEVIDHFLNIILYKFI